MKNVLIVSGHTNLQGDSFASKIILEDLQAKLSNATFDFLDQEYPNFKIDVTVERKKLEAADIIVLQFPIFWYSMPSLMAKWMEDTFVHGWSHGSTGKALHGKKLLLSFTTGAPADMYVEGGIQMYPVETMTTRFQQMANLCGLVYEGYIYTGGVSYASRPDAEKVKIMEAACHEHADRVITRLKELSK